MQDHNRVSLWAERYLFALLVGTVVVELLVFVRTREWGWRQFLDAVTDWEIKRYFEII